MGMPTFKNLSVEHLDARMFDNLKNEMPSTIRLAVSEIFEYLKIQNIRQNQYLQYLLYVKSHDWEIDAVGNGLTFSP